jgi:hypothetical protein
MLSRATSSKSVTRCKGLRGSNTIMESLEEDFDCFASDRLGTAQIRICVSVNTMTAV